MRNRLKIVIGILLLIAFIYWLAFCGYWVSDEWYVDPTKVVVSLVLMASGSIFLSFGIADELPH